jgi:hypothetical protein
MLHNLGEYVDPYIALEQGLRALPGILEDEVQSCLRIHAPKFFRLGSSNRLIHSETYEDMPTFCANRKTVAPHGFSDFVSAEMNEQGVEAQLITDAMLTPTLGSLGRLQQKVGDVAFAKLCEQYGVDIRAMDRNGKITPGVRPSGVSDEPETKSRPSTNPFSPHFVGSEKTRQDKIKKSDRRHRNQEGE